MTKVSELQNRMGKVELTGTIVKKDEPRTFDKFGKEGRVANARIKDDSGEVTLTLWNEQVDQVKEGDVVTVHNGWVSEFRGELQLGTGKFGSLEVGGKPVGAPVPEAPAASPKPAAKTVKVVPKPAPAVPSAPVDDADDGMDGVEDDFAEEEDVE